MILSRRGLIVGLGALVVSPAIVRAENLMKITRVNEAEPQLLTPELIVTEATRLFWASGLFQIGQAVAIQQQKCLISAVVPFQFKLPTSYSP